MHRRTRSCGCIALENAQALGSEYGKQRRTHGMSGHWLYSTYASIKQRCRNEARADYRWYGGDDELGPAVCEFERVEDFLDEVEKLGERPSPEHTIDRLPGHRNYGVDTMRWATKKEQTANRVVRKRRSKIERLAEEKAELEASLAQYMAEHPTEYVAA